MTAALGSLLHYHRQAEYHLPGGRRPDVSRGKASEGPWLELKHRALRRVTGVQRYITTSAATICDDRVCGGSIAREANGPQCQCL